MYHVAVNVIWIFDKRTASVTEIEITRAKKAVLALVMSQIVDQEEQQDKVQTWTVIDPVTIRDLCKGQDSWKNAW